MKLKNKHTINRPITSTSLSIGIIGLPNIGKSHLFNLLTNSSIPSLNYPFCTIDPNTALCNYITDDLIYLKNLFKPIKTTPTIMSFKDIAGLIKDSHKGQGLGNKFLSYIRESHIILHIIRTFNDPEIIHINNFVDPITDYKVIRQELLYCDAKYLLKKYLKFKLNFKVKKMSLIENEILSLNEKLLLDLFKQNTNPVNICDLNDVDIINDLNVTELNLNNYTDSEIKIINTFDLLSLKYQVVCLNVSRAEFEKKNFNKVTGSFIKYYREIFLNNNNNSGFLSNNNNDNSKDISNISTGKDISNANSNANNNANSNANSKDLKMPLCIFTENNLPVKLLSTIYTSLSLITMYTCGPKEVRAYSIYPETLIVDAASLIHTDFSKYFISADVYNLADLKVFGCEANVKKAGKVRVKGKTYVVTDGDIVKFNIGRK
ncbi:Obg-like ATPase 1 [Cucumispora dikerogammari]|nr:Obg-like ATPase 1 [Cucumispora dikerogammari]